MQNIKICPKCNQVAPSARNTFCPFDAAPLIEMQPIQNIEQSKPVPFQLQSNRESNINSFIAENPTKKVSPLLGLGIFFMPYSFAWLTLRKGYSSLVRIISFSWLGVILLQYVFLLIFAIPNERKNNSLYPTPTVSPTVPITSSSSSPYTPSKQDYSALSPKENLEAGKKALSQEDLSAARSYLSAIPKSSQEYASAKQLLAKLEIREERAKITNELQSLASENAKQEELLNQTENMEGSIGKQIYLNALKRKAEIQLRRLELERKLKKLQ